MRLFSTTRGLVGSVAVIIVAALSSLGSVSPPLRLTSANPVAATSGTGVKNVTFYYDGKSPLKPAYLSALRREVGRPGIIVAQPRGDGDEAAATIHALGAKAYRYVQFYWSPNDPDYAGINLKKHPGWSYCRRGGIASLGRTTTRPDGSTAYWHFVDTNEVGVRSAFRAMLRRYKAAGWDGIMVDRGEAATQFAADAYGHPIWDHGSTCTNDPAYRRGIPFASSFVRMLGIAHEPAIQLQVMLNNGKSAFDPVTPMRPNPGDSDCRSKHWQRCSRLDDVWPRINLALNESAAKPYDWRWNRTFTSNQQSERNPHHGRRTVALITTATLGGANHQRPHYVFYEWSRIKLFNLAVAVNTGDRGCAGITRDQVCNQYDLYPGLTNSKFGSPVTAGPHTRSCASGSRIRCVWVRQYYGGASVVNVSPTYHRLYVSTKTQRCKYVYSVWAHQPLRGNKCVHGFYAYLPAWSGRPVRYKDTPW